MSGLNDTISFLVSIDVEEDMPDWKAEDDVSVRNISAIPRLQKLFDQYGIKPTYLLSYPFAEDEECVSVFSSIFKDNRCEIGSHLHPWTTPPVNQVEKDQLILPSALEKNILETKLINLTNCIKDSFGFSPLSYRAGRFGFDLKSAMILKNLGYKVDTSVTPLHSWKCYNGPSFLYDRVEPHTLMEKYKNDALESFLEIPVSIALTRELGMFKCIYLNLPHFTKIRGLLGNKYLNIVDLIWLYPVLYTHQEMIKLSEALVKRKVNVLNMFLHSNELKAGESVYHKTEKDIDNYFDRMKYYFDYVFSNFTIKSRTLSEYYNIFIEREI